MAKDTESSALNGKGGGPQAPGCSKRPLSGSGESLTCRRKGLPPIFHHHPLSTTLHPYVPLSTCLSLHPPPLSFLCFPFPFPLSHRLSRTPLPASSTPSLSLTTPHPWLLLPSHSASSLFRGLSLSTPLLLFMGILAQCSFYLIPPSIAH